MENHQRRIKSICSSNRFSIDRSMLTRPLVSSSNLKKRKNDIPRARPATTNSSRTFGSRTLRKAGSYRNSRDSLQLEKLQKNEKVQEVYFSNKLSLAENSFIFDQDAFKLQNLITGGYCCDDEYMSLSKFNQSKQTFILLKEIYDKAKRQAEVKKNQKQATKSRNIFSIIYLNNNLKQMGKRETKNIFEHLKIVG